MDALEESKCGYVVTCDRKKLWDIEINILKEFMRVCDKNKLQYFVAHGTLLGAVRHKGFIPWDDDIDVNMPREDYEKLKLISSVEFKEPYFFQTFENDHNNFVGHGKLRYSLATGMDIQNIGIKNTHNGLFIDVFPMDGIIEDIEKRKVQSKNVEFYRGMLLAKLYGRNYSYFAQYDEKTWKKYKIYSKCFSAKSLNNKFEQWVSMYSSIDTERTGIIAFKTDYECCYWYKKDYAELIHAEFEKISVPIPKNYDNCLKIKWNNYMEFPPVGIRGKKHDDVLMNADTPFHKFDLSHLDWRLKQVKHKPIILFGAGGVGKEFLRVYGKRLNVTAVCDNNHKRWGDKWEGLEIIAPLKREFQDKICIVTCQSFQEIERQLKQTDISDYYIFLPGRIYR